LRSRNYYYHGFKRASQKTLFCCSNSTESYHRKIAAARNIKPLNNNFHDLNIVILSEKTFFLGQIAA
jgi:hypothetical protein